MSLQSKFKGQNYFGVELVIPLNFHTQRFCDYREKTVYWLGAFRNKYFTNSLVHFGVGGQLRT